MRTAIVESAEGENSRRNYFTINLNKKFELVSILVNPYLKCQAKL